MSKVSGFFCFISISKFGTFKNPFATISSLPKPHFRCRGLVQTKEVISMAFGSSTSSWKPWRYMRPGLILTKFNSSSRSTKFKKILLWKISQMITKLPQTAGGNSLQLWKGASFFEFERKSMETETTTI